MTPLQYSDTLLAQLSGDFDHTLGSYPLTELHNKHLFITGGTGFIGLWLLLAIQWLNTRGARIEVTLLSRNPASFLARYPSFAASPWLHWVIGDVKDYRWPNTSFDAIIHGAADTSPQVAQTNNLFDDITIGTRHVIAHAVASGIRRLLLLSSGAVYGEQPMEVANLSEDDPVLARPLSAQDSYALGKRHMETITLASIEQHGLEPVIARCFSFIGFGLAAHLAISQFVRDALCLGHIRLNSDGTSIRSYQHASDLAAWLLALLNHGQPGSAYNVGSPEAMPLIEVATRIRDQLAPGGQIQVRGHASPGPRQRYVPDTQYAEKLIGVKTRISFDDSIRSMARALLLQKTTNPENSLGIYARTS